jgi:hypothetical protein
MFNQYRTGLAKISYYMLVMLDSRMAGTVTENEKWACVARWGGTATYM